MIREAFDDEALAVVAAGAASLARCLERLAEDDPVRASAIDALFELLRLDIELGGFGLADEAVKLAARHMTPDERADVAERLDELSDEAEDEWAVRSLDELSLELEANRLDDETFLKRCRKQGLTRPLFDRLATLGRWDEAIAALGKVSDHELPEYADLLVERGRPEAAERLMRTRFARRRGGEDWWLGQWLERFYVSRKAWPEATEIARDRFVRQPDRAGWLTLRDYATRSGTWETVRAEAARAADRRASPADRIRIHLDEGEIDAALRRLEAMKGKRAIGTDSHDLRRDVARAAEESRPEASLALYWAEVELLILGRSREGYRAACEHLRRLRGLYDRLGRSDEWRPAIEAIRQENPRLRALHDELRRAGL